VKKEGFYPQASKLQTPWRGAEQKQGEGGLPVQRRNGPLRNLARIHPEAGLKRTTTTWRRKEKRGEGKKGFAETLLQGSIGN